MKKEGWGFVVYLAYAFPLYSPVAVFPLASTHSVVLFSAESRDDVVILCSSPSQEAEFFRLLSVPCRFPSRQLCLLLWWWIRPSIPTHRSRQASAGR